MRWLFLILLLALSARAEDLKLLDGTVLREIRLREKTDLGIRVLHESGLSFVDYRRLPVPVAQTWGYEEAQYQAAYEAQGAELRQSGASAPAPSAPAASPSADSAAAAPAGTPSNGRSQCAATTKKGTRCKRKAQAGREYCYQHP